jgi:hypothetical protein
VLQHQRRGRARRELEVDERPPIEELDPWSHGGVWCQVDGEAGWHAELLAQGQRLAHLKRLVERREEQHAIDRLVVQDAREIRQVSALRNERAQRRAARADDQALR